MGLFGGDSSRSTTNKTTTNSTEQGVQQGDGGQATIISGSGNNFVDPGAFAVANNAIDKIAGATQELFANNAVAQQQTIDRVGTAFSEASALSQGKQQFNLRELAPFGLALAAIVILSRMN